MKNENNFCEIAIKSKIDYVPFKNYFYQNKDEYSVHNSFRLSENKFLISGFVFMKLFSDFSVKFTKIVKHSNQNLQSSYSLLKINETNIKKLNELIEFYCIKNDNYGINSVLTEIKMERIHFESMIIVQEIYNFYEKYSSYFSEVDNYFKMNEITSKLGCSSFIILTTEIPLNSKKDDSHFMNLFNMINPITNSISPGNEIITLSSNLGVISYDHFSKSYSKGIIANLITNNIYLLDVRVLPNSHGAIVFKNFNSNIDNRFPFAIILPILNVRYSYTPIIYALRLTHLMEIVMDIYDITNESKIYYNSISAISNQKPLDELSHLEYSLANSTKNKINLIDTVFLLYNLSNYATCFYIGTGRFITNKHFFSNESERIYIKNYNFNIECEIEYIPENNIDLAVIKIKNYQDKKEIYDKYLNRIKIADYKPSLIQPVICVGFSYFDKKEILNDIKYPNMSKGILSKIITRKGDSDRHMIYQVDCSCFSGGSGGPVVDENGQIIGVLFQNLSFNTSNTFLQLPNSGFLIAKDLIEDILECLNKKEKLSSLWIFNLQNDEVDLYFNYRKLNPKF